MKRRNPLLAGFFNVLIPGSSYLYVGNNWLRFVLFFVVYSIVIFVAILVGNNIQNVREYTLPQGLCTGTLLLAIFAFLFYSGMKMASARNSETDSAAHYQSMRTPISKDDPVARLAKLQRQRDEGLISSEQQEAKKAEIETKEK
jgi:hypothetical protein